MADDVEGARQAGDWLDQTLAAVLGGAFPTFVLLTEARLVMFNAACRGRLFPATSHQGPLLKDVSPVLDVQLKPFLDRAFKDGAPAIADIALTTPDGRELPQRFGVSCTPLRRGNVIIGVICACRDETPTLQAEARLRAAEAMLDTLSNLSPSLLLRLDPCGQVRWMNPECHRYVGQSLRQVREEGWVDWIHPSERQAVMAEWGRSTAAKTPFDHRHRLRSAQGSYGWFQVRCLPQFDDTGRLVEWYAAALPLQEISPFAQAVAANADGRMVLWVADPSDWTLHVLNPDPAVGWPMGGTTTKVSWTAHLASIHAEDRASLQAAFETLARGQRIERAYRAVTDRGDLLSVMDSAFPVLETDGVVSRFVGLSRIVSALPARVVVVDPSGERHVRVAAAIRSAGFQPEVVRSLKALGARRPAPPCVVYCSTSAYVDMLEATRTSAAELTGVPLVILGDPNASPHEILTLTRQGVRDIISYEADPVVLKAALLEIAKLSQENKSKSLPGSDPWGRMDRLTGREREILELAAAGGTSKTIGRRLNLSPRTVDFHRSKALDKLGLDSVTQASALFSTPAVRPAS